MRWIKLANITDLAPGEARTYYLDIPAEPQSSVTLRKAVVLANVNGTFYCLDNTCPHLGGPLGEGWVEEYAIICPLHYWEFDVRTGQALDDPTICVATYPCKVEGTDILIGLEEASRPPTD